MNRIHPNSVGLAFAAFLGTFHALWAVLIWAGGAQWLLDFVFRLHMITPPYHVTGFNLFTAATLVLVTAGIGYASGCFIGFLWNQSVARPPANYRLKQEERHT